ncbi:S26 family signal peptidase [Enterobacter asburiae]
MPHPRSRLRTRLALAGFATVGLAALARAAFVQPLPRTAYNPSDSVAVGWYRIEPFDPRTASRPRPAVRGQHRALVPLPGQGRQRRLRSAAGLPTRVPLLKRVGAVAPRTSPASPPASVRIDGVPVAAALPADRQGRPPPSLQLCRRLEPGELFLLSVTNPASFDSRYFGPVSASTAIGVAHPIWLETRP